MGAFVTQAEFARMHDVSEAAVAKWKKREWLVMQGSAVDVDASNERIRMYRDSRDARANRGKIASEAVKAMGKADGKADGKAGQIKGRVKGLVKSASVIGGERVRMTVAGVRARLEKLDWEQEFDWSKAALSRRVELAANCTGLEAAQSNLSDDGHWGGYQLRHIEAMRAQGGLHYDSIMAGYGYELGTFEVLEACRDSISDRNYYADDDWVELIEELLPVLAMPFGEAHELTV